MPKLAANLTMLFNEMDFVDRFRAAAESGFTGVEYLFPYDYSASMLAGKLEDYGLVQVLHNLPAGDWSRGDRGIGCVPDRVDEFKAGVDKALAYAATLGCTQVNCLAGIRPAHVNPAQARDTLIRNVSEAARRLKSAGIRLLIEAVNTRDVPGFFLSSTEQALDVRDAVGSDNVFLQYDAYHMHVMGEDIVATIRQHVDLISHIQIADAPGRHEPGSGSIDFDVLLNSIDRAGYTGWIGCEYNPATTTLEGLGWSRQYLPARTSNLEPRTSNPEPGTRNLEP